MAIMIHAKFHFNRLMLILIFGIRAWRTTEKAGPDRVNNKEISADFALTEHRNLHILHLIASMYKEQHKEVLLQ